MAKEKKIHDITGKFVHPLIKGDARHRDADWTPGRIILSNKRIWLVSKKGKSKISLKSINRLGGKFNLNQKILKAGEYLSVVYEKNSDRCVSLITSNSEEEIKEFKNYLYHILIDNKVVYLKHPVSHGGVMQNAEWKKAKTTLKEDKLNFVDKEGNLVNVNIENVQNLKIEEKTFKNDKKESLEVEHVNNEGVTVVSYVFAPESTLSAMRKFIGEDFERNVESEIELNEKEKEIIMALYSGVSPFDIPDFIDEDIEKVEEIFEKLIELDALNLIRERKEVDLTTRGRNLASKIMGER